MVYSRGTDKAIALPNRIRLNTNSSVGNSIAEAFVNVGLGESRKHGTEEFLMSCPLQILF